MKKITNFAIDLDENTKKQFKHCCSLDYVISASLMPDAHSGYVAPIGSVFAVSGKVIPSWVGYDIGCGMIACVFKEKEIIKKIKENAEIIFNLVNEKIPMGKGNIGSHNEVSSEIKDKFKTILEKFTQNEHNPQIYRFLKTQALAHLGSLGSGNHFIEFGINEEEKNDDQLWLIIHSGSRGVGHKVATHYMKQASQKEKEFEETHPLDVNSKEGKEYLNILDFGLEFALLNRLEMAYRVRDVLRKVLKNKNLDFELWVNKNHNHAVRSKRSEIGDQRFKTRKVKKEIGDNTYHQSSDSEEIFIHRKGATPAAKGERGVIPANMRDGCFLVEGLGNKDYLESSSHGAGRKLSRLDARKTITIEEFKNSMKGIIGKIDEFTLDEAPDAYKNIYDVMQAQKDSVKIIAHLKPIINWKG